jgi:hypothetical protein
MTYDVLGDGKTVLKANYGTYWWNPGADFVFNISPNASAWWRRHRWTDANNDNRWQPGEESAVPTSTRGGAATESLDPDLKNTYTQEFATFLERELMPNFGVRAGYVWRGQRDEYGRYNIAIPYEAFTVPVTVRDPGPDGALNTADDGTPLQAMDLAPEFRGLTPVNRTVNPARGGSDYHTFEITGTKRMSSSWSLLASYGWTKSFDQAATIQGNAIRGNALVMNPNDEINTEEGRFVYTRSNAKLSGTWETPFWGISMSPMLRYQQGIPFGRTFASTLSYGSVRFLAEPMGTRRQDTILITDLRVEKTHAFSGRNISVFFDLYNMFNQNPAQNLQWSSGTSWNRPLSIVPPRLARIGAKLNF